MTKQILSVEVTLTLPGFQNFGARMEETEQQSFWGTYGGTGAGTPSDAEADDADFSMAAIGNQLAARAKEMLEANKASMPPEEFARLSAMMGQMGTPPDWDLSDEDKAIEIPDEELEGSDRDLQEFIVHCGEGRVWDANTEAQLDRFVAEWPVLRPLALQAVFESYREFHEINGGFGVEGGERMLFPEPSSPAVLEDLFRITSIYLHEEGRVGLSGDCTWDDEHGVGILLGDGKVIEAGQADTAYGDADGEDEEEEDEED